MDDFSYGALAVALSLVAGVATWFAYQKRGLGAGLKGAGITLLPIAAWLTDTLEMLVRVGDAVGDWATRLVFSPVVWVGIVLAGVGVLLYGAGRVVDARTGDAPPKAPRQRDQRDPGRLPASQPSPSRPAPQGQAPIDDDLADIEAILKNRGIS
ncbi:hypothetical protein ABFT23_16460 [Nocardioides sp. C4-1]|uniref:hypothetical protein n=1 Tax=Nocardioides sp. C4-1 TaxID=3151851 RepID=UPI003267D58F